ncbi:MAG: cobalamin-binding protein [Armatimonadaceae bacterium]
MRIVSLLPSATEIVCALGLTEALVGVTHECDFPGTVRNKPVVTSSLLPSSHDPESSLLSAEEIDARVRQALDAGESLYRINHDLLRDLKPDLILTQGLCDVCAVNHATVKQAVEAVGSSAQALDLAPTSLAGVQETFRMVGAATGRDTEAEDLIARTEARWQAVRATAQSASERPRTLLLEWTDPPFSAGHWNPELLELANGIAAPWDETGIPSRTLSWEEILDFQPEMIVLMACGFDTYRSLDEAFVLPDAAGHDAWFALPAVRAGDCYAVDGNAYFNRPGPRLAESAEILATILHPDRFTEMMPPFSAQRFAEELIQPSKWVKWQEEVAEWERENAANGSTGEL